MATNVPNVLILILKFLFEYLKFQFFTCTASLSAWKAPRNKMYYFYLKK